MAELNRYMMYTYSADNLKNACDDKVLIEIEQLKKLKEYDEVVNFVNLHFGIDTEPQEYEYPNNVKVAVVREENSILVAAKQNETQIFGLKWVLESDET